MTDRNEQWGSRVGVILAVAGSAVGLGNFLRFPGQAASNGGGAFLIPYFAALLLLGIPIAWVEWTMGRYGGKLGFHSTPAIMGVAGRGSAARYLGVIGALIPLAVSFYYVFIEAWTLGYFLKFITGGIGIDRAQPIAEQVATSTSFYSTFTGSAGDGVLFTGDSLFTVACWAVTVGLNVYFVYRGLSRGIEKFCLLAMPAMAVCAAIVLVRVLTLGTPDPAVPDQNVVNGLGYMWNPDYSALTSFQTWLAAAGQIFFSLSVGFGVVMNYASYMPRKSDVALSSLTAASTNEVFEVGFGGLITLTASFLFLGLAGTADAVAGGTFGLGFTTLPIVFAHMGALGNVIGATWFLMLFLAAITSSLSMYQPVVALFMEALGLTRKQATTALVVAALLGSFPTIWFSGNGAFLGTVDFWVGTFLIFVLAMVEMIIFAWFFGLDRGWRELHDGAAFQVPRIYRFIMKYVAPAYLLVVFVGFCIQNLPTALADSLSTTGASMGLAVIVVSVVVLFAVIVIGERRWRAEGLPLDGEASDGRVGASVPGVE